MSIRPRKPKKKLGDWISQEAKENASSYANPYLDNPVRKFWWIKSADHPIGGLALYSIPKDHSESIID